MKAFLNVFRQFSEINFGDSRFASQNNAVRLDAADLSVFVFLAVNRFEVVAKDDGRETDDQDKNLRNPSAAHGVGVAVSAPL